MTVTTNNDTAALPNTLEGWRARAQYFQSLYKIEKLENARLRASNRKLNHCIHGPSSEKLSDAQRLLLGILADAPPPPMSDATKAMMKEARKGVDDRGSEEPK